VSLTVLDECLRGTGGRLARGIRVVMKGCATSLVMMLIVMHSLDHVLMHTAPEIGGTPNLDSREAAIGSLSWLTRVIASPILNALERGWSLDIILPYSFTVGFGLLALYCAAKCWLTGKGGIGGTSRRTNESVQE
jgi:hypothetical protein